MVSQAVRNVSSALQISISSLKRNEQQQQKNKTRYLSDPETIPSYRIQSIDGITVPVPAVRPRMLPRFRQHVHNVKSGKFAN